MVLHPRIQSTNRSHSTVAHMFWKKSACKWACTIKTHVFQELTVILANETEENVFWVRLSWEKKVWLSWEKNQVHPSFLYFLSSSARTMDMMSSMEQHLPWGHNMRNRPRDSQKHWQWHYQTSETTQADPCLETSNKTNPLTYCWSGFLLLVTKSMLWQYFDYLYFTIEETGSDSSIDLARGMVQVQIFPIPNHTFFSPAFQNQRKGNLA